MDRLKEPKPTLIRVVWLLSQNITVLHMEIKIHRLYFPPSLYYNRSGEYNDVLLNLSDSIDRFYCHSTVSQTCFDLRERGQSPNKTNKVM